VYLETTIPSYLTAAPSRDLIIRAHQEITVEWWTQHRHRFEIYISDLVLQEVARGDRIAASKRLEELAGIAILEANEDARELAREFVNRGLIPQKAVEDAFHVAIAIAQGMDFLLTWNCRHIANAEIIDRLQAVCEEFGFEMPTLCTPEQLMGN
jgi:predicted nucleic acid-binding protein